MYDQIRGDIFFIIIYTLVTGMAMMASCYLLLRRGNAFALDITPPLRLRRWTAVLFASITLDRAWYMLIFFHISSDSVKIIDLVGGVLDSMTFFPLAITVLLTMLQDRRRPLWPVVVMMAPIVVGNAWSAVTRDYALLPFIYVYFLLMCIGIIVYMVHAVRQYGRWLRDNYADLEHKEVWQSFVVLVIMLLVFVIYAFTSEGVTFLYTMQIIVAVLVCYLLWRVETLSDLSLPVNDAEEADTVEKVEDPAVSLSMRNNIGPLLKKHCEESCFYLEYDISLSRLARKIGINRHYLSHYFSSLGMNYNAYINDLRINHFVSLYREAVNSNRSVTAKQLALECGYHSYSTFCYIIKRKTGLSVTAWMKGRGEP